jgi:FHA domain-containing protein
MSDLPSGLRPLADYARDRQSMSRDQFLAKHSTPVLIVPTVPPLQDAERFSTRKLAVGGAAEPSGWAVVRVQKRAGDAFPNFIWVGREAKCDITLPYEGVSKLHAQFILRPGGEVDLLDTSSANGTFLDGARLEDNAPRRVRDGARIQMGVLEMTYRSPEGLWTELVPRPGAGQGGGASGSAR